MALIKKTNWKGFDAEYWTITRINEDKFIGKTVAVLNLFKDKALYESVKNTDDWQSNALETHTVEVDGIDLVRKEIYPLLKTSKIETRSMFVPDEEKPGMFKQISEEIETSYFADAEDDI